MKTKKTPEQFKQLFNSLHPTLELLSDYISSTSSIKVKCKICGKEWTPRADTLKNIQCTTCKKSEKYKQQINEAVPNIEILTPIIYKVHDHVKCKCKICNYEWDTASTAHLKQGHGCPNCAGICKKSNEEITDLITNKHSNLQILKIENKNNITVQCKDCGSIRTSSLNKILQYSKCEVCSGYRWNTKTFIERMSEINSDVEILGEFKTTADHIKVKCKKCGRIWQPKAKKLLEGLRCTCINGSKGELLVESILKKLKINYIHFYTIKDFKLISQNRIIVDFYIPDYNTFIEYNGKQHYVPIEYFGGEIQFNKQKIRDKELRNYCKENKINLIEIKYNLKEEDVEEIIKQKILNI